ncbi:MAG TPA: T9SS type A sorting domain-containing protein, partial [Chitinophagaceae bacterium]|nr:T9SS type A sorting domain-containing protein [Chitinophagaceae bacterium]
YYRLNITANNGETGTQFAEWELYEKRLQTISFDSIPAPTFGDDPFELVASSSSGLPVDFTVVAGPAVVDSTGFLTLTGAGTVTVRATQAGNDNYFADSVEQTFTVNKAPQDISFETINTKTYGDSAFALVATTDSHLPLVFEVVSGPATIADSILTITGAGDITVRVSQAGNDNYLPGEEEQTFTVNKASQTISFDSIPPTNVKDTVHLSATSSAGLPVDFSVVSGPGTIAGNVLSFTCEGSVIVQASQPGNENYLPATPVNQTVLVYADDKKKDRIKLTVYPNPTRGQVKVKLDNKKDKDYTFTIYNDRGIVVASTVLPRGAKTYEVNFNITQKNGLYFLYVTDGSEIFVRLILKY